jgi:hypothetical protein
MNVNFSIDEKKEIGRYLRDAGVAMKLSEVVCDSVL